MTKLTHAKHSGKKYLTNLYIIIFLKFISPFPKLFALLNIIIIIIIIIMSCRQHGLENNNSLRFSLIYVILLRTETETTSLN